VGYVSGIAAVYSSAGFVSKTFSKFSFASNASCAA